MEGKKINVYYKGVKQTLKVFDNTEESDFLKFIKRVFHIESDISKIFLQDDEGNLLTTNAPSVSGWDYSLSFGYLSDGEGNLTDLFRHTWSVATDENVKYLTLNASIDPQLSYQDQYAFCAKGLHLAYQMRYLIFAIAIPALILTIICFISLMTVSGRRPNTEELVPGMLHKIPSDLMLKADITLKYLGEKNTSLSEITSYHTDKGLQADGGPRS